VGNTLYFSAYGGVNGYELWKSDGTAAGTTLVKDIYPGASGSSPESLTVVGNTLYFRANDDVNGIELWKSDGTAAGTTLVKDIYTGSSFGFPNGSFPTNLTAVGNTLYFIANDGVNGIELWKSDGTAAGTTLVKDINPGANTSYASSLTAVGNTLYFRAYDEVNGSELWKSDGTAAGTTLVKDIYPGSTSGFLNGSFPEYLTPLGNTLYFVADDGVNGRELWKSDGTAAGTTLVKDIYTGPTSGFSYSFNPSSPTVVGNTLYFVANDGVHGRELWKSDGTAAGTTLVMDIYPNTGSVYEPDPSSLTVVGNTLYFTANDGVNGRELWALNTSATLPTITLAVSPASVLENGTTNLVYTFSRTGATTSALTVNYTVGGTATLGTDYTGIAASPATKTVSFAAGSSTAIVTVDPTADSTVEPDETVALTLASGTGYSIGTTAPVTGTITNDDLPVITLAVSPSSVTEDGPATLIYTFSRSGATTSPLTVNYTVGGTADASDYTGATPGTGKTITFAAGSATATLTIDPTADTTVEADETVALTLASGTGYSIGTTAPVTGTITNDDVALPVITLAVSPASVSEDGTPNLVYTFSRSGATTSALTVNYTVGGTATLGTDYTGIAATPATKTVSFAAGSSTAIVTVDPTADSTVEADETVALTLATGTGYTVGTTTPVTGTITNDDVALPVITLAVSPASVLENGTANLVYTFSRTGPTTSALTVNYSIGGTADASDYTGASPGTGKTITFAAGSATATLTIDPTADSTVEPNETVALTLATGTGYTVGTTTPVTGTITNDDVALPVITLAVSPASVLENGTANLVYTFSRSGATTSALTVNYTVGGTANASDYTGASPGTGKTITFAAGSATAIVTVDPTADSTVEADETVALTLATGTGYTVGTTTPVTGTITNDDVALPVITLAVSPASVLENGTANLVYTFSRSGPTTSALTVNYTVGGTATLGTDYTGIAASPATKTLSFAAGSSTAIVTVDPTADSTVEANETVSLTLAAGTGYTVGTTTPVTGTITNDDLLLITLTASDANAGETVNPGSFTLTRTGPTTSALTVLAAFSGTASNGTDYTTVPFMSNTAQITFAVGSTTAVVTLNPIDDLVVEGNETGILTLFPGSGYSLGATTSATVTLTDNDSNGTNAGETLTGDAGNNALNGLGGNDSLNGGGGNDQINGGFGKDTLTGGTGTDQFVFSTLGDSLLASFDVITDYALGEQLDAPGAIAATTLNVASGTAANLTAAAIQAVLTSGVLTANSARAFTVTGQTGTFIALNDGVAGFNASTDSILHLSSYTIGGTNTVAIV
jgi:ELWxxDGT repeat protein